MSVRIDSVDRLVVGDKVTREGVEYVVAEAVVWSDAWGDYAVTTATLEPAGGEDEPGTS